MKFYPKKVALIIATKPSYELFCPNFTGMQDGLDELGIEYKVFSCRPSFDPVPVIEYNPDLIVYGLPDMAIHKEWRMALKSALPEAKIVMWYGDWRGNLEVKVSMPEIDLMVASNNVLDGYYEKQWGVKKVGYLPLGASIKTPVIREKYQFPVVFVGAKKIGSFYTSRAMKLTEIENSGIDLHILNGDSRGNPLLRAKIMAEVPSIYRSAKITLDMSHFSNIKGYTSNRFWVISASGGFPISEWYPQCEEFYPEGTRVYFKTIPEAIEKINYYLTHDDEREKIRLAGYEHAKNHTYDKRWKQMFDLLSDI